MPEQPSPRSFRIPSRLLVVALLLASTLASATLLVSDVNLAPAESVEPPTGWYLAGSHKLLLINDGVHGQELWSTGGEFTTTRMVKDINPGAASSGIFSPRTVNGVLFFFATSASYGTELWRSDGTEDGTYIVADINPGPESSISGSSTAVLDGVLYFAAADAMHGQQAWRSDGTSSGTWMLTDSVSPTGSVSDFTVVADQRVFFTAEYAGRQALWSTNGRRADTRRVTNLVPDVAGLALWQLAGTSSGLFFMAEAEGKGRELWFATADGSSASLLADLSPGARSTMQTTLIPFGSEIIFACQVDEPGGVSVRLYRANGVRLLALNTQMPSAGALPIQASVRYGNRVLMSVLDSNSNPELWVTDGTVNGTRRLGGSRNLSVRALPEIDGQGGVVGNDGVYFEASTVAGNIVELWRTDGTEEGTARYATMPPGYYNSAMAQFAGKIWFAGGPGDGTPGTGSEPWVTDGTVAGTMLFKDLNPGSKGSDPRDFHAWGDRLYFTAYSPAGRGPLLWTTTGDPQRTEGLSALPPGTGDSSAEPGVVMGNPYPSLDLLFRVYEPDRSWSFWKSNGFAASTYRVSDCYANGLLGALGERVLVSCSDAAHGSELWIASSNSSMRMVLDINPGASGSNPQAGGDTLAVLDGIAYFPANDGTHGNELWRTDGTAAGTYMVVDLAAGAGGSFPRELRVLGGRLLFLREEQPQQFFWWSTDGTAAGTQRVSAAAAVTSPDSAAMGDVLYFGARPTGSAGTQRSQLWRTDGTAAGTQLVADPSAGAFASLSQFVSLGDRVAFVYCGPAGAPDCRPYSSDGTSAGTISFSSEQYESRVVQGGRLFYTARQGQRHLLRVSDGTVAGTRDILSAQSPQRETFGTLATANGQVLVAYRHPVHGPSLWRTDGTPAGTQLVADFDPGNRMDAWPLVLGDAGRRVLVSAYSPRTGRELYALNDNGPNLGDDEAVAPYATPQSIPVLANDGTLTRPINPSTLQIMQSPRHGNVSIDAASGSIIYTGHADFSGPDSFTYMVADSSGASSDEGTVTVTVMSGSAIGPAPGVDAAALPEKEPKSGGGSTGPVVLAALAMLWLLRHLRAAAPRRRPVR